MAASLTLLIRRKRIKLFWVRKKQKYGIKVKMRQKCKNETENSAQNFQNIYETDKVK